MLNNLAQIHLKLFKKELLKTVEETSDLIDEITGIMQGKSIAPMQTEIQLKIHQKYQGNPKKYTYQPKKHKTF